MKIAYVTTYASSNIDAWSGSGYNILQALQNAGIETKSIGNLREKKMWTLLARLKNKYYFSI